MIKRYFIALFLFLLTFGIRAQDNRTIDSLKTAIQNAKHDTSLCYVYLSLGEQVYLNNPDTAILLFQKVRELAKSNLASNPPDDTRSRYLYYLTVALNNIGHVYERQGNISKTLEYHHTCLKIQEEEGNLESIAYSSNKIGLAYQTQGNIPKALEYLHKSLKIQEELEDNNGIATALNNIGTIYYNQDDTQKALEYYQKCLKICEEVGDDGGLATALNNIGSIYNDQGDFQKALKYHYRGLKLREQTNHKKGIATSLQHIGTILCKLDSAEKGLALLKKGMSISQERNDKLWTGYTADVISAWYVKTNKVDSAEVYAQLAMRLAQELDFPMNIQRAAKNLSHVYRRQAKFKLALEMYELHIQMRDSVNNEETQKATIRQQTKYEFEKAALIKEQKKREAARLESEIIGRRDNLQYSIVLICLLAIGVLVAMLGRLSLPDRLAEGIIFFSFLILFEFLLVLADPYIETWSGGAPGIKLLFNAGIAALIFPAHAFFESRLKGGLVKSST